MATATELVAWATAQADLLETDIHWVTGSTGYSGYWEADDPALMSEIRARATSAIDFLERFAGSGSQWSIRAQRILDSNGENQSFESGARALSDVLRAWTSQVEAGVLVPRQIEAQGARAVASTDLMEQVRLLLEDPDVHPSASIVLAGAALEIALRSAIDELDLPEAGRSSISAYSQRLRKEGVVSAQDVKDIEQMAGLRNAAAHGNFDELSRERAGLLEQQVNLFLHRLAALLDAAK